MNSKAKTLPKHVAIVMDGNGRWAERRNLLRMAGHEAGVNAVERIIRAVMAKKIPVLTLFAFGIENWQRPASEVKFLMQLFVKNLYSQADEFVKNNIQLRVIGDRDRISDELCAKIDEVQKLTADNDGLILVFAFNYSGRWDIVQATRKLCEQVVSGSLQVSDISYQQVQNALSLNDLPEPDLFIRTSGELRISNFMLWQFAYTELYFTEVLWPDFDEAALEEALRVFSLRQRRYGLTAGQLSGDVTR